MSENENVNEEIIDSSENTEIVKEQNKQGTVEIIEETPKTAPLSKKSELKKSKATSKKKAEKKSDVEELFKKPEKRGKKSNIITPPLPVIKRQKRKNYRFIKQIKPRFY